VLVIYLQQTERKHQDRTEPLRLRQLELPDGRDGLDEEADIRNEFYSKLGKVTLSISVCSLAAVVLTEM
jgi:hypothetical protein